jgi:hypothetical protein
VHIVRMYSSQTDEGLSERHHVASIWLVMTATPLSPPYGFFLAEFDEMAGMLEGVVDTPVALVLLLQGQLCYRLCINI